jgi:hypothetical protein
MKSNGRVTCPERRLYGHLATTWIFLNRSMSDLPCVIRVDSPANAIFSRGKSVNPEHPSQLDELAGNSARLKQPRKQHRARTAIGQVSE